MLVEEVFDSRVTSALIGALVVAVGWFATGLRERRGARRARRQRVSDLRIALAAEIEVYVSALRLFDLEEQWLRIVGRMEADPGYVPAIPTERNDVVFLALIEEVRLLPEAAIGPVVRYYSQLFAIGAIVGDLRSELFREMDQPERIEMYTDYIGLKLEALERGEVAVAALRASGSRRRA